MGVNNKLRKAIKEVKKSRAAAQKSRKFGF